jgi:hypothetical protein
MNEIYEYDSKVIVVNRHPSGVEFRLLTGVLLGIAASFDSAQSILDRHYREYTAVYYLESNVHELKTINDWAIAALSL